MHLFSKLQAIFDLLIDVMAFLGGVLLAGLMLLVTIAVASRYFLQSPIGWVIEVCEYTLVVITFLIAAWVLKQDGHVRMDLVLNVLKPKARSGLNAVTLLVSALVCFILSYIAVNVTWELYQGDYFTPTILQVPKFIFIIFISLGLLTLGIQFVRMGYTALTDSVRRDGSGKASV